MSDFPTIVALLEGSNVDTALKNKSEKSGIPMRTLRAIYNRGLAAWRSSHRPGTTANQWAMARVNSVIAGGPARKSDKDLLEAVDRNKLTPKERKVTPPSWLEGVMLEFIVAGVHTEFVEQGRLRSIFKLTQFSTGQHVGNLYFVKQHDTYYCQVNQALPTGKDGSVVWRGTANHTWPRKPKPADVEANKAIVLELLMQAVRKSKSLLPLVEAEDTADAYLTENDSSEYEYNLHLGDGVFAQMNRVENESGGLRGRLIDIHERWQDDQLTLHVVCDISGDTTITLEGQHDADDIETTIEHPVNDFNAYVKIVLKYKRHIVNIAKNIASS